MNKRIFAAATSVTAAIAAVGLITTGTASASTSLGPATNSCAPGNGAMAPVAVTGGVFIADPAVLAPTGVRIRSIGTGSLDGDMPGQPTPDGIFVPTHGIGVGTLSGTYLRGPAGEACSVNGTFMLS